MTPEQAVRLFTERAAECERKGLPKCAADYRHLAANAHRMPDLSNAAMKAQREPVS